MKSFGFQVAKYPGRDGGTKYLVELPHSCGTWEITRTNDLREAKLDLVEFISQAHDALDKLVELGKQDSNLMERVEQG